MKHFVQKLWMGSPKEFAKNVLGDTHIRDFDEAKSVLGGKSFSLPSFKSIPDKVIPVSYTTLCSWTASSRIFHETFVPAQSGPQRNKYFKRDYDKTEDFLVCGLAECHDFDTKSEGQYEVPPKFLKILTSVYKKARVAHDCYSTFIKKTPLTPTLTGNEKNNKKAQALYALQMKAHDERRARCLSLIPYIAKNDIVSLKSFKRQVLDAGELVPEHIWREVELMLTSVTAHLKKLTLKAKYFDINKLYADYEKQVARNEQCTADGTEARIEAEVRETYFNSDAYKYYLTANHKCDWHTRVRREYNEVLRTKLAAVGFFNHLTWNKFKTHTFNESNGNRFNLLFKNNSSLEDFLLKGCKTAEMDKNGNIKTIQKFFNVSDAERGLLKLQETYPAASIYKSEAIFHNVNSMSPYNKANRNGDYQRRVVNQIAFIPNLFVDIDLKDSVLAGKTSTQEELDRAGAIALRLMRKHFREQNIPHPSTIEATGGGFHIRWNLDVPFTHRKNGEWDKVTFTTEDGVEKTVSGLAVFTELEKKLQGILAIFGADPKAIDGPRVLRPDGFTNAKRGVVTTRVYPQDGERVARYSASDLASSLLRETELKESADLTLFAANLVNLGAIKAAEDVIAEADEEIKEAKAEGNKEKAKRARKKKDAAHNKAIADVRESNTNKLTSADLDDLDETGLENALNNYTLFRSTRGKLPKYRSACKFEDKVYYDQRLKDILSVVALKAKKDNLEIDGEKGVMGDGDRNSLALYTFHSLVNSWRDDPRHYGKNPDRDPYAFVERAYNETYKLLLEAGMGRAWLDSTLAKTLVKSDSDENRGIYTNVMAQLEHFWKTGEIINANHYDAFDFSHGVIAARDTDEGKLADYKRSPIGPHINDNNELVDEDGSLKVNGRFPQLGYTVSIERIMIECHVTDSLALEAGAATLYCDKTRETFRSKSREIARDKKSADAMAVYNAAKNGKTLKLVTNETSEVLTPALRIARSNAISEIADKLGYTTAAVNKVARDYANGELLPKAYSDAGLEDALDFIKAITIDIHLAARGRKLKTFSKAIAKAYDKLGVAAKAEDKIDYIISILPILKAEADVESVMTEDWYKRFTPIEGRLPLAA